MKTFFKQEGIFYAPLAQGNFGKVGDPDLIICYRGRFIAVEVKTYEGVQSGDQKRRQKQIEDSGGIYLLAKNIDVIKQQLIKIKEEDEHVRIEEDAFGAQGYDYEDCA